MDGEHSVRLVHGAVRCEKLDDTIITWMSTAADLMLKGLVLDGHLLLLPERMEIGIAGLLARLRAPP